MDGSNKTSYLHSEIMCAVPIATKPLQDDFTIALSVYGQQNYTRTVYSELSHCYRKTIILLTFPKTVIILCNFRLLKVKIKFAAE
jgi:hypothetical protein